MKVRKVSTPADRRAFLDLPATLYRDRPLWVAPLRRDERAMMNRRHPFYRHSDAAFFVLERDGTVVGRIAVLDHRRWNTHHGTRSAIFTLFEVVDDEAAAQALFDAAASWGRERGLTDLIGPMGMLPDDGHGILVEGFELPPAMGVGYHPPYYDRLVKSAGFAKATDYLSGRLAVDHEVPAEVFAAADAAAAVAGYQVKRFTTRRELRRWVEPFRVLYNEAFAGNWEFAPIDPAEMAATARRFMSVSDPRLVGVLLHGKDVAGYLLILPDISEALRRAHGRLTPWAVVRIMRAVRRADRVSLLGFGIAPTHRGDGANLVLYATLARQAANFHFTSAEAIQVEEGNVPMMRNMATLGVPWDKRHRIYRRDI
jgi:hypothetical protein